MPTDDANPWDGSDGPGTTTGTRDAGRRGTAGRGDAASPARSEGDGPTADDGRDEGERRKVLVVAAVVFVLLAAVAFFLTRGGDDEPVADDLPGQTSEGTGGGGAVAIAGTTDSFERPDTEDGLGTLPNGTPWQIQSGRWAIRSGEAAVVESAEGRNTVFLGTGYPDPQVQVRLATVAHGAGLVFRYRGECNYWAVYPVPAIAVWNVEKVIDCAHVAGDGEQVFRVIDQAPVADGTTIGVVADGDIARIVINGQEVATIDDPDLAGVGRVGLTARGAESTNARWDDVIVGGPEGQGVIAPASTAPGPEGDEQQDPATEAPADDGAGDGGDGGG